MICSMPVIWPDPPEAVPELRPGQRGAIRNGGLYSSKPITGTQDAGQSGSGQDTVTVGTGAVSGHMDTLDGPVSLEEPVDVQTDVETLDRMFDGASNGRGTTTQ